VAQEVIADRGIDGSDRGLLGNMVWPIHHADDADGYYFIGPGNREGMCVFMPVYMKYNLGPREFPKTNIFFCPQLDIFSDYVGRKYNLVDALGPRDEVFMIGRFIRDDSLLQ
jgi:hypothetical protein